MPRPELQWIKAASSANANACVELAPHGAMIAVRNSKDPGTQLFYTHAEMAAFLEAAKRGEFDHLINVSPQ